MKAYIRDDKGKFFVFLTMLVISVCYLSTLRGGHDWGGDFAQYFEHARNIAEGNDYARTAYIKNPYRSLSPDVYPPGLPLLISVIYYFDGFNFTAIKVMSCLFFFGSLILVYFMFRGRQTDYYMSMVLFIIALYPRFWEYKDMTFSEYPFIFFSFFGLFLTEKAFTNRTPFKGKGIILYASIVILIIMASATRVVGGILIPVILIYFFQKHGKLRYLIITSFVGIILVLILYINFKELLNGLSSYFNFIEFNPKHMLANTERYASLFSHFWDNYHPFILNKILSVFLFLFALAGFYFSCEEKITIYDIFFVLYLSFLLTLPWPLNRFLLPLYPIYVYYTIVGINQLMRFPKPMYNYAIKATLLIFVIQVFIAKYKKYDLDCIRPGISTPAAVELFDYIEKETEESSVIVFRKPRVISLFTKRKSLVYHTASRDELSDYLNQQGATHLIIGKFYDDYDYFDWFLSECSNSIELELSNSEFRIYKVMKPL